MVEEDSIGSRRVCQSTEAAISERKFSRLIYFLAVMSFCPRSRAACLLSNKS